MTTADTERKMTRRRFGVVVSGIAVALLVLAAAPLRSQQAPPPGAQGGPPPGRGRGGPGMNPMLPQTAPQRVSEHVYALVGFPNIVFVVGSRGTLVVDTGLGPKNGAIAAKDAATLAVGNILYLTTTHFHPEHAAGEGGFPAGTILIRPAVQERELEADSGAMVKMFAGMGANGDLLAGVQYRKPDVVFDREAQLDLGGVTARLFWMGTAHTLGDELTDVEPDKTLISGDVVQNKMLPSLYGPNSNLKSWINILAQLQPLQPLHIVPDHGSLGDGSLLTEEYTLLSDLQARALELKRQGESAGDAGQTILAEFKTRYAAWPNLGGVPDLVSHVYSENP